MKNMKRKTSIIAVALLLAASQLFMGCGAKQEETKQEETKQVATKEDMAESQEVGTEDMEPITADQLRDGVYTISVDSSSPMFQITNCELTVENGEMTARMTMGGTGYLYVYMGTGEEAVVKSNYIPYEETASGEHTFTVPVAALDEEIACAAYSKKKEMWYDRELVFRADTLPAEAYAEGQIITCRDLALEDGEYTVDVKLEGGSGKSSVESPARMTVKDDAATVVVVWSSKNYDYMRLGDEKYMNENEGGNSTFTIPVTAFDRRIPIVADTTAMSEPHEIEYTLYLEKDSIEKAE